MMQDTCPNALSRTAPRSRPADGGYVTIGTLILASVSAVMLVLMSGCHSTPAANAFAATAADKAVETRLRQGDDAMPALLPFDEHLGAEIVSE